MEARDHTQSGKLGVNQFVRPVESPESDQQYAGAEVFPRPVVPGTVDVGGLTGIGGKGFLPDNFYTNKFSESDDVLGIDGSHSIKFGVSVDRIQDNTSQSLFLGGTWSFASLAKLLEGRASTALGLPLGDSDGYKDFRSFLITPYFQDDWKITSKLTLNLGWTVRLGRQSHRGEPPHDDAHQRAVWKLMFPSPTPSCETLHQEFRSRHRPRLRIFFRS